MKIGLLSWIAYYVWFLTEIGIVVWARQLRRNITATKSDKGSFWLIYIGIIISINFAFISHFQKWGWVSQSIANIGAFFMICGVIIRIWAIWTLGRNYSAVVAVDAKQTIIKSGPYRLIRHPAYTGSLITISFLGLTLNSWTASLLLLIIFLAIYGYRIYIEEKALLSHFDNAYKEYSKNTWKIIPFIW